MKPIKILDLFAGTQSVKKAITKKYCVVHWEYIDGIWKGYDTSMHDYWIVEYIGIDIDSPEDENTIFDLSQDDVYSKLLKVLPKGWTPDFIWASPVCNKLSIATTGPGGNSYFIVNKERQTIAPRIDFSVVKHNGMKNHPEKFEEWNSDAVLAQKLHNNTRIIIECFGIPFAIENPATALSKYIYKGLKRNVAYYCMYGFDYKKPTAIYSTLDLNLKKCNGDKKHRHLRFDRINRTNNWPSHWIKENSLYANRSSVPPELIGHVIEESIKEWNRESNAE